MTTLQSYLALHACGWYNVFLLRLTWVNHSLSARRPSTSMAAAGKPGERRYLCVSNHRNEYEVVVILDPSTPEEEQANLIERIKGYVAAGGGAVASVETGAPWGRRTLAYPIRKATEGYYSLLRLNIEARKPGLVEKIRDQIEPIIGSKPH